MVYSAKYWKLLFKWMIWGAFWGEKKQVKMDERMKVNEIKEAT